MPGQTFYIASLWLWLLLSWGANLAAALQYVYIALGAVAVPWASILGSALGLLPALALWRRLSRAAPASSTGMAGMRNDDGRIDVRADPCGHVVAM